MGWEFDSHILISGVVTAMTPLVGTNFLGVILSSQVETKIKFRSGAKQK